MGGGWERRLFKDEYRLSQLWVDERRRELKNSSRECTTMERGEGEREQQLRSK